MLFSSRDESCCCFDGKYQQNKKGCCYPRRSLDLIKKIDLIINFKSNVNLLVLCTLWLCLHLLLSRQNFTLATMDNCKKFAVIVSITTICSYINFSHSIWQRTAPKQLRARLTRTLSLVWGRTDKFCQVELNALKEKEENLLWWALRENWRSLKHFKKVIVGKNRNENL